MRSAKLIGLGLVSFGIASYWANTDTQKGLENSSGMAKALPYALAGVITLAGAHLLKV